jgi:predicted RNase H-like nuclease
MLTRTKLTVAARLNVAERNATAGNRPENRRGVTFAADLLLAGHTLIQMYFVGVDLAWGVRNPTGVAVIDSRGSLVHVGAVRDDADVLAALQPYVQGDCLVAFDAPLVVINRTGQRPAEAAFNRDFRRFEAGAHPVNTGKPEFANGCRAARLAQMLRLDMDPRSSAARRAIEVYPHPATVALFRLPRTLKYKAKPGRGLDQLKSELLLLMDGLEGLAHASVRLKVAGAAWAGLRRQVQTAQRKSDLRRAEDPIDAVVCAYVALYAERCPDGVTIYGDFATGYIVTPSLRSAPDAHRWALVRR